ncbi:uncharacterized protein LOC127261206 [Andrographis paniculata]|uniref:uncharacterized protein LOC127261206 n=1 Tax=Andrographis paniculata TaxID=175694 RepID=UPI0021E7D991|nr:uncharacterized protein LOC127261206 [Andrographis paniculata]
MDFYLEDGKQLSSNCTTLILPALSIGNVGQLAVDLLISSLKAERVGYLDEPNVLPCAGNDAYSPSPLGKLALPLEAYESSSSALTLLQQRSPVIKGMVLEYAKNIASFAAKNGMNHVVILSSLDFGRWKNIDMSSGLQVHYLSNGNLDGTDSNCESNGWKRLQDYDPTQRTWKYLDSLADGKSLPDEDFTFEELEDGDYCPSLPFAALFSCFKAKGLKVTCLLCYCSEGDNIPEAFALAEATSKLVGLNENELQGSDPSGKWTVPFSWQSVYGPPADTTLF